MRGAGSGRGAVFTPTCSRSEGLRALQKGVLRDERGRLERGGNGPSGCQLRDTPAPSGGECIRHRWRVQRARNLSVVLTAKWLVFTSCLGLFQFHFLSSEHFDLYDVFLGRAYL